jgi:hypothetical protein
MRLNIARLIILILILLSGAFSKFYEDADSLKEGLLVASSLAMLFTILDFQSFRKIRIILSIEFIFFLLFITLHGFLVYLGDDFNVNRFVLSILFLCLIGILWIPIKNFLFRASPFNFDKSIRLCYWILVIDGILSTIIIINGYGRSKEMLFASEPSHFALTYLPFLFYMVFRDKSAWHLLGGLLFAIFVQNITALAGVFLIGIFYFRKRKMLLLSVALLGVAFIFVSTEFNRYLFDRLNLALHFPIPTFL